MSSGFGIILAGVAGAALAVSIAGCALFHHGETPQQQFTEAIGRGNSVQASYIWNNMSPQDRAKFARGEGISPQTDSSVIAAQIQQHQEDEPGGDDDNAPVTVEIPVDNQTSQ